MNINYVDNAHRGTSAVTLASRRLSTTDCTILVQMVDHKVSRITTWSRDVFDVLRWWFRVGVSN